jgi:hypothetical protein
MRDLRPAIVVLRDAVAALPQRRASLDGAAHGVDEREAAQHRVVERPPVYLPAQTRRRASSRLSVGGATGAVLGVVRLRGRAAPPARQAEVLEEIAPLDACARQLRPLLVPGAQGDERGLPVGREPLPASAVRDRLDRAGDANELGQARELHRAEPAAPGSRAHRDRRRAPPRVRLSLHETPKLRVLEGFSVCEVRLRVREGPWQSVARGRAPRHTTASTGRRGHAGERATTRCGSATAPSRRAFPHHRVDQPRFRGSADPRGADSR